MPKAAYRNALRSRRLIQHALAELLHEKPPEKITVSDVVRRADVNRSTFYAHYTDIPAVLDHLIESAFAGISDQLLLEADLAHAPRKMLKHIQQILASDLEFYKIVMTSRAASMVQERIASVMLAALHARADVAAASDPAAYEIPLAYCTGGLIRLYQRWFAGDLPISLDALTEQAAEMIMRTVTAR